MSSCLIYLENVCHPQLKIGYEIFGHFRVADDKYLHRRQRFNGDFLYVAGIFCNSGEHTQKSKLIQNDTCFTRKIWRYP